jgi:hypothetical protein
MLVPDDGFRKETTNVARLRHKNYCLKITLTEGLLLLLPIQYPVFVLGNTRYPPGLSQIDTRCSVLKYGS